MSNMIINNLLLTEETTQVSSGKLRSRVLRGQDSDLSFTQQ